jgi:hypothetical protein
MPAAVPQLRQLPQSQYIASKISFCRNDASCGR